MTPDIRVEGESVTFWLKVKPHSSRDRLTFGSSGDLRLEVGAPPTGGQANEACVHFLARALRLPQACVVILAGKKARRKLVRITGHSAQGTIKQLETLATKKK